MAVITATTFDPLKVRCNVRLQQGVPIVDADWNEGDDIRKFELRAFLKWFLGDGVPAGCDGFRIAAVGTADDLAIQAGAPPAPGGATHYDIGLRNVGRCVVDGLDAVIQADVNFKAQPLFAGPAFGAAQIQPIPVIAGAVLVYLDVWERLVTSQEDPSLVLPGLGTESCARMKREWAVRARAGSAVPAQGDPDWVAGHSYLALAALARKLTGPNVPAVIAPGDLADLRHTGLTLATLETRLATLERLLLLPSFVAPGGQLIPKAGNVGQVVTLRGRNFDIGTPRVTFGAVPAVLSGTPTSSQVAVVVPNLAAGVYSVAIATDGGGPVTADDQFTVVGGGGGGGGNAPTLDALNPFIPKSAKAGSPIVLTGTNFNVGGLAVSFGLTPATVANSSATQINATVPNVPVGAYTITVTTNAGSIASPTQFNVVP